MPLLEAIHAKDLNYVLTCLKLDTPITDQSPLQAAIETGDGHIVTALLKAGAPFTDQSLPAAIDKGNQFMVIALLEAGAPITPQLLPMAIKKDECTIVEVLLKAGAQVTEQSLPAAIETGNHQLVALLLYLGNAPVTNQSLPVAMSKGYASIVKIFSDYVHYNEDLTISDLLKRADTYDLIHQLNTVPSLKGALGEEIVRFIRDKAKSQAAIQTSARLLAQGARTIGSLFATLPNETLVNIAAYTKSDNVHDHDEACHIANRNGWWRSRPTHVASNDSENQDAPMLMCSIL